MGLKEGAGKCNLELQFAGLLPAHLQGHPPCIGVHSPEPHRPPGLPPEQTVAAPTASEYSWSQPTILPWPPSSPHL